MRKVVQKYPNGARYPAVASVRPCQVSSCTGSRRAATPEKIATRIAAIARPIGKASDQKIAASAGGPGRAMCA